MESKNKENLINYILLGIIITSYFFGFYLNEDSAGGGEIDFIASEWNNIKLFKQNTIIEALSSLEFRSSRTPLFPIIQKYNFFANSIEGIRTTTFFTGIIIFLSFYLCLRIYFPKVNKSLLLLISSFILLSPYFRSSVFWANQEHLAILFFVLCLIFFNLGNKNSGLNNKKILSSLFAFLSFYSDQKFFFLPIIVYFYSLKEWNLKLFLNFSLINFLFFLPTLFLFLLWGGIVPVESQWRISFTPSNLNILISSLGIYFIPIFLFYLSNREINILKFKKNDMLILIPLALLLAFLLPSEPAKEGSGIVFRFLSLININNIFFNWTTIKIIYYFINIFFVYLLIIILEKSFKNLILILSLCLIYFMTSFTYQSYVDPLTFLLIYLLFDLNKSLLIEKKFVYLNGLFFSGILLSSILFRNFII